jgi:hypothetical protein
MTRAGIEQQLDGLGFRMGNVNETIITTMNPDGSPNAAAMGILRVGQKSLEIRPFKMSSTYENLMKRRKACINITDDPALFLVTTFKNEHLEGFQKASITGDLRLESSDAHVFIDVLDRRDISEIRSSFRCVASSIEVNRRMPKVFSRGRSAAIEAIVHATRIEVFMHEGRLKLVERLIKRFDACKDVVSRVSASDSTEARVIKALEMMIEGWRGKASR